MADPTHGVIQVVFNPALADDFRQWLADRRLMLSRIPVHPDDLPTYVVTHQSAGEARHG
ncbi:MAG TPA: hypothetical protein VFY14_15670 [Streptomyces sp.]|nr:hypothetical protein [Streptomyces sp.]